MGSAVAHRYRQGGVGFSVLMILAAAERVGAAPLYTYAVSSAAPTDPDRPIPKYTGSKFHEKYPAERARHRNRVCDMILGTVVIEEQLG